MATTTKLERDAVAVDPKHYTIETETETVRVVRIRYGGREKSVMHQHPRGVGIFLTDSDFTFRFPDGRAERVQAKRGEHMSFDDTWEHDPENNTDEVFEALYIELK